MGRNAGKWPHKAIYAAENVQKLLRDIEEIARGLQEDSSDRVQTVMLAGDIRAKSQTAFYEIVKARMGAYDGTTN